MALGDQTTVIGECGCCGCCLDGRSIVCLTLQATDSPFPTLNEGLTIRFNIDPSADPVNYANSFHYPGLLFFVLLLGEHHTEEGAYQVCYQYFVPMRLYCSGRGFVYEIGNPYSVPLETGPGFEDCPHAGRPYEFTALLDEDLNFTHCQEWQDFWFYVTTPGINLGNFCGFYWDIYESLSAGSECDSDTPASITVPGEWFEVPTTPDPVVFPDFVIEATVSTDGDCDGEDFTPSATSGSFITNTFVPANEVSRCNCPDEVYDCIDDACIDPLTGFGEFTGPTALADCQDFCEVTPSWTCEDGFCFDPGDGSGIYPSEAACDAANVESWDCVSGNCLEQDCGTGAYPSEAACEENCQPAWECVDGVCVDLGVGNGSFFTEEQCDPFCPPPVTYNCDSGVCTDPGNGSGTFTGGTALADCEEFCADTGPVDTVCCPFPPGAPRILYFAMTATGCDCLNAIGNLIYNSGLARWEHSGFACGQFTALYVYCGEGGIYYTDFWCNGDAFWIGVPLAPLSACDPVHLEISGGTTLADDTTCCPAGTLIHLDVAENPP